MAREFKTREQWLTALAKKLEKLFTEQEAKLPPYRVGAGFPSVAGLATQKRRIGECWSPEASNDDTVEIIISLTQDDPMKIAGIVAHELVHAAVGTECGHKGPFRELALAIGLCGKMTSTDESDAFKQRVRPWLDSLGPYPHARLDHTKRKKQGTRLLKCECSSCGYTVRTTAKWLDLGAPICPVDKLAMEVS